MAPLSSPELDRSPSNVSDNDGDNAPVKGDGVQASSSTEAQPGGEEEVEQPPQEQLPPKLSTVNDYDEQSELIKALAGQNLEDWTLPKFDVETSVSKPNSAVEEAARLLTLKSYNILDSADESDPIFDDLTKEAQAYFKVPFAVVSFVDFGRQWFKSIQGLPVKETPRCIAFCPHVVKRDVEKHGRVMVVNDASKDPRFMDNPMVVNPPGVRFYAGCALKTPEGQNVGTFCIIDVVARPGGLTKKEQKRLESFADETVLNMILRDGAYE